MVHKVILVISICLLAFVVAYIYYYYRWKHLWTVISPIELYHVPCVHDDTIRVIMIGDSWAGIHSKTQMDTYLCSMIKNKIKCPVSVVSKGKGGEKCKGIYQLMFQTDGYGTKPLFLGGVDYCIISAGINDAAANLGTKQFCAHYHMILDFLLTNGIRPVIVEVPDVDIWTIYGNKPPKDLLADYIKSTMTRCKMYHYHEYREALYTMLQNEQLLDKVVLVPMTGWNGEGDILNPSLFMEDKIHLNHKGYEKLDYCIAVAIANDLKQFQDSALVNYPMCKDSQ